MFYLYESIPVTMVPIVLQYHMYMNCLIKLFRSATLINWTADTLLTSCSTHFFTIFFNFGARGKVFKATTRPLYRRKRDPVPIVQEAGRAPGPVWMGAENLALTGNRSTDTPDRSRSLYRLSYPNQLMLLYCSESQYAYLMRDFFLKCLTVQDGTNSLSRSVGNQLRTHAAEHPRRAQAHFTLSDMILIIYLFFRMCADGQIIASSSFS